ncbi:hypothetical protein HPULCUR_004421 [Helicostylum pulchrum]|uniref:F-box domain-containing protein n=1 Tax=Helicostylum pulchrum TaxID=562976 RepID=A0ABP9XY84_9FUNG
MSLVTKLPDELQIKILKELPVQDLLKSTMVCHKWDKLVYDGSLWTTLNVTPFYKTIPTEHILKLVKCSSHFLKTANFRGCIQLTGHSLRVLAENCPNTQALIIKDCRGLSASSIGYCLQKLNQLKVLDVSGLDTIKFSTLLGLSLAKLQKLNMSWCRNITGPGIVSMITTCSNIQYLKLNGCPQLDHITMASLGSCLPHLSHLSLAACTSLVDTALLSFLKSHSHNKLTHLNLSSCARLTDASLRNLAIYSNILSHLELAGCVLLTDQGFNFLSPRLRTLVYLDLEDVHQITGATVKSIAKHQPHLESFCLSNCTHISDDSIKYLVLQGICHRLQHIELDNCNITDQVLNTIAIYLEQQYKRKTSTDSNSSFFSFTNRRISVEVLDCSSITESGVKDALAKASPMLTIKSFYSFQQENIDISNNYSNGRYATGRRGHAAGQHQSSANCIIL